MSRIIGIDLGTTNSCVSIMEGNKPIVIPTREGNRSLPSVVSFKDGKRSVGESARRQAVVNPDTVMSVKSEMGTGRLYKLGDKQYLPTQISAMILQTLKVQAEEYLGEKVDRAVITVPAYFNDAQRRATKDAALIAGLEVERIINEPTAAALAYGLDQEPDLQTVLVYDMGGGTFDVSILRLDDGLFEVIATRGDNNLGGDQINELLVEYILETFNSEDQGEIDVNNVQVMARLLDAVENAKKELSLYNVAEISLPFLTRKDGTSINLEMNIDRATLNRLIKPIIDRTEQCMIDCLSDAKIGRYELDKVLLVGGSTRIPAVADLVEKVTGVAPSKGVNPDEVVAMGAAVQGGIFEGLVDDLVLVDVVPLTLGIETAGGIFTPLIERNTPLPATHKRLFTTAVSKQKSVNVQVYQGERPLVRDNYYVGNVKFDNITPMPRGIPKLEVTFHIDHNGILAVTVEELVGGKNRAITAILKTEASLSPVEIEEMIEQSELMLEQDRAEVERVNLINSIESSLSQIREVKNSASPNLSDSLKEMLSGFDLTMSSVTDHKDNNEMLKSISAELNAVRNSILIQLRSS